jgi:hypothetical protein
MYGVDTCCDDDDDTTSVTLVSGVRCLVLGAFGVYDWCGLWLVAWLCWSLAMTQRDGREWQGTVSGAASAWVQVCLRSSLPNGWMLSEMLVCGLRLCWLYWLCWRLVRLNATVVDDSA